MLRQLLSALCLNAAAFAIAPGVQAAEAAAKPVLAVIQVKVKDPQAFMAYVQGHLPSVKQYGGSFLLEARAVEPFKAPQLQGTSETQLFIVQQWPSREAFNRWWNSDEYRPWNDMRSRAADVTLTLSEPLAH